VVPRTARREPTLADQLETLLKEHRELSEEGFLDELGHFFA